MKYLHEEFVVQMYVFKLRAQTPVTAVRKTFLILYLFFYAVHASSSLFLCLRYFAVGFRVKNLFSKVVETESSVQSIIRIMNDRQ